MNITDSGGLWRLKHGSIENMKTGEVKGLEYSPSANAVAYMSENSFVKKCSEAFASGTWPQKHWVTD